MIDHVWLLLLLAVLATARLTRLVTDDAILDRPRDAIYRRSPDGALAYFVSCPWCVSMWLGAGVAAAVYWRGDEPWVQVPLIALAASHITGLLALKAGQLEDGAA